MTTHGQVGTRLRLESLTSNIGAAVQGIDLRDEIAPDAAATLCAGLYEHLVLVFRGQAIGVEEQRRLLEVFATSEPHPLNAFLGDTEIVTQIDPDLIAVPQRVADAEDMGDYLSELPNWHTDGSFCAWIPKVATLRAEVIPPVGGDTGWTNLRAAYAALSPLMQGWLDGVDAFHSYGPPLKLNFDFSVFGEGAEERFDEAHPPRLYPLVVRHPETGKKNLFLNPAYTASIDGLSRAESKALLRLLYQHVSDSRIVYRHHWHEGDVVVWDELATLHLPPQDFHPHRRRLVRMVGGRVTPTR